MHTNTPTSYTVTLTNTYTDPWTGATVQVKTDTVTIVLKNPCERAIIEDTTSPFSTINVPMPTTGFINTPFKIYTDLERAYPLI
jgi:hypothetical protein